MMKFALVLAASALVSSAEELKAAQDAGNIPA